MNSRLINEAQTCISSLESFRKQRSRCKDYLYGRQWNDIIEVNGRKIREYEYIVSEGNIPLKNNLIRRIVRNVLGTFRKSLPALIEEIDPSRITDMENNRMHEIYARTMEEFLVSGMAIHRKWTGVRNGVKGLWTDIVSPESFFFNPDARDPRGWDMTTLGMVHEVGFNDWCDAFVKSQRDYEKARYLFNRQGIRRKVIEMWRLERSPRYLVHDTTTGKVIKLTAEQRNCSPALRKARCQWRLEPVWRYYFIDEEGNLLLEGDSPYKEAGHPFVVKCYPFLDGEIHSFVSDIIDQQRYTNRLITMYDWVIRASAKGVLLLPEGAVEPENLQEVADSWSRFNGVITYRAKPGVPDPKQVNGATANPGISELLEIQLKMLEDVSGVNAALQGNLAGRNISGTLYNQQTENAMNSLQDLMESFADFIACCKKKEGLMK